MQAESIFQHLLERMACYLPLQDAVAEVSHYAMKNFKRSWLQFVREYPNFPDEVLRILAQNEYWEVRRELTWRELIHEDILKILARDADWVVRMAIAGRDQDLPGEVLKILAQDEYWWVRQRIANCKQAEGE